MYRLLRSAKWRREEATVNQKNWLRTRLGKGGKLSAPGGDFNARDTFTMTKGQAADLITRMKHGALVGGIICELLFQCNENIQGRGKRQAKAEERALAKAAKEEKRRAREHVKVGPLSAV